MATGHFKERGRKSIVANLPPSSMAFYYHCLRASRQIVIWLSSFEQYMNPPAMTKSGYKPTEVPNRLAIEWTSLPAVSDDLRLVTCGQCSSGCTRCKCGLNKLSCTFYCQCKGDACTNRSNIHVCYSLLSQFYRLSHVRQIDACFIGTVSSQSRRRQ